MTRRTICVDIGARNDFSEGFLTSFPGNLRVSVQEQHKRQPSSTSCILYGFMSLNFARTLTRENNSDHQCHSKSIGTFALCELWRSHRVAGRNAQATHAADA
eukprot:2197308-Amphidinium_carterae.1